MGKHKSTDYKLSAVEYYLDNDDLSLRDTCDIYKSFYQSYIKKVCHLLKKKDTNYSKKRKLIDKTKFNLDKYLQYINILLTLYLCPGEIEFRLRTAGITSLIVASGARPLVLATTILAYF
jgi:hypothetical protein